MTNLGPQFDHAWSMPEEKPYAGQSLYHGTAHQAEIGDTLHSPKVGGHKAAWSISRPDKVYSSEDEMVAWTFAHKSRGDRGDNQRMRVYDVTPKAGEPTPEMGPHHSAKGSWENLEEWTAPHHTIKDTIDVQPGNQGTLPHVNWHQFADKNHPDYSNHNSHDGFNHPEDPDDMYTPDPVRVQEAMGGVAARANNEDLAKGQGELVSRADVVHTNSTPANVRQMLGYR